MYLVATANKIPAAMMLLSKPVTPARRTTVATFGRIVDASEIVEGKGRAPKDVSALLPYRDALLEVLAAGPNGRGLATDTSAEEHKELRKQLQAAGRLLSPPQKVMTRMQPDGKSFGYWLAGPLEQKESQYQKLAAEAKELGITVNALRDIKRAERAARKAEKEATEPAATANGATATEPAASVQEPSGRRTRQ